MPARTTPPITLTLTLLLCGCTGLGQFVHDTTRRPGRNPNAPQATAINHQRVLLAGNRVHDSAKPVTMDVDASWPGPPKDIPSLQDLQRQQNEALANGTYQTHGMAADLPNLPGYVVTPPEPAPPAPAASFPNGTVPGITGSDLGSVSSTAGVHGLPPPDAKGNIIVPNGDGTSTVIAPNGTVSTLAKPK